MPRSAPFAVLGVGFRWLILGLVFALIAIATFAQTVLMHTLDPFLIETGLADAHWGLLLTGLGLAFIVALLPAGIVCDRCGARSVLTIAAGLICASMVLAGFSGRLIVHLIACVLLGFGGAMVLPALNRVVADWFSPHERAMALAWALLAFPLAWALSNILLPPMIAIVSWRACLLAIAAAALLWSPAWFLLFRDDPSQSSHISRVELQRIGRLSTRRPRLRDRQDMNVSQGSLPKPMRMTLIANLCVFAVQGYAGFFCLFWISDGPLASIELPMAAAVLPWLIAAALVWLGGFFSDRRLRTTGWLRNARSMILLLNASTAILALGLIGVLLMMAEPPAMLFLALVSAAFGTSMGALPVLSATVIDICARSAAALLGLSLTGLALAAVIAPILSMWIAAETDSMANPLLLLIVLEISTIIILIAAHRPDLIRARRRSGAPSAISGRVTK